tara:strand:+ start:598 stop:732 length:135 start_codon:yes stop_codon:yes gene_type:complete
MGGSKKVNPKTKNIRISKTPINEVIKADFFSLGVEKNFILIICL